MDLAQTVTTIGGRVESAGFAGSLAPGETGRKRSKVPHGETNQAAPRVPAKEPSVTFLGQTSSRDNKTANNLQQAATNIVS